MKIYNDSIENAVGVNSTSFGEYIGSAYSTFTPPVNGLMVQGNVGIGTTSPTQSLHVQGALRLTGGLYDGTNSQGSSNQVLTSTGSGIAWTTLSAAGGSVSGAGSTNSIAKFNSPSSLTNSNITDNGSLITLGVAASANAQISMNVPFGGTSIINIVNGSGLILQGRGTVGDPAALRIVGNDATIYNDAIDTAYFQVDYKNLRNLVLLSGTYGNDVSLNRLLLNARQTTIWDGSHTTAPVPTGIFEVASGLAGTRTNFRIIGTANQTADFFQVFSSTTTSTVFVISASGRVGIGTSSPTQSLHVLNNMRLGGALFDSNNNTGAFSQMLASTGAGVSWINGMTGSISTSQVAFANGPNSITGVSTFVLNNTGLGVNTSVPLANLHVRGGVANSAAFRVDGTSGILFQITDSLTGTLFSVNNISGISNFFVTDGITTPLFNLRAPVGLTSQLMSAVSPTNATYFSIASSGNVGIATSSPTQSLHVQGNARITGGIFDSNNSIGTPGFLLSSTGSGIAWTNITSVGIITGTGVNNSLAKFNGTNSITSSNIFDNGAVVTIGVGLSVSGFSSSFGFYGPGTFITNLNASNLAAGTVPSAVISGSYTGITTVGTLVSLTVTNGISVNSINIGRGGGNVAGNTLVGAGGALNNNTSGALNAAFGWSALGVNTTEGSNSAFGYDAGAYNRASQTTIMGARAMSGSATTSNTGNNNTAIGFAAGRYINSFDNTAIGQGALQGNSTDFVTGIQNVAVGKDAAFSNTTGNTNTIIGRQAGYANTSGNANVAVGNNALFSSVAGNQNTYVGGQAGIYQSGQSAQVAVGYNALAGSATVALNTGQLNTALGYNAGAANTSGSFNVFVGHQSGSANTSGGSNVFIGYFAGQNNTIASNNIFIGATAGGNTRSGGGNVAMGISAFNQNTSGTNNVAVGRQAAYYSVSASDLVAVGNNALFYYTGSGSNTAVGSAALFGNATTALNTGVENTAVGQSAGLSNTSGTQNVFIGHTAGNTNTTGSQNTYLGHSAGTGNITDSYQIAIGQGVSPAGSNRGAIGRNANATRTDIGIGTYNPLARMHIETLAAANQGLYIAGAASQTGALIKADASTNGTQLFVVSGIGSVGINTAATPTYLWVQGDTRLNGPVGIVGDPVAGYPLSVSGSIYLRQGDVLSWSAGNADIQSGGSSAWDMRFRTFSGIAARENMRIMSNGNVGIGTSGPFARLHVQGLATTTIPLILSGFGTPIVDLFRIESAIGGTRYITVDSAGELGIGTSSPTQSLHVQNGARFNGLVFDSNNVPGTAIGIVSQALFSTGVGVTWATIKRNLVVPLMTAFNPTQVGIDSAIFIVPQDPINGTSSMTFNFRRVNVRVETPSAAGITTINIAKSTGTGQFVGTSILSSNINLTGAATYEANSTTFAVGYTTASSGDKLAINFVGVNTFHQNLTVELIAIEA